MYFKKFLHFAVIIKVIYYSADKLNITNKRLKMGLNDLIILAEKEAMLTKAVMKSSAHFCIENATECKNQGMHDDARIWAIKSLAYSVGVFSQSYKKACEV